MGIIFLEQVKKSKTLGYKLVNIFYL